MSYNKYGINRGNSAGISESFLAGKSGKETKCENQNT